MSTMIDPIYMPTAWGWALPPYEGEAIGGMDVYPDGTVYVPVVPPIDEEQIPVVDTTVVGAEPSWFEANKKLVVVGAAVAIVIVVWLVSKK